jgi:hypothetical protein
MDRRPIRILRSPADDEALAQGGQGAVFKQVDPFVFHASRKPFDEDVLG